MSSSCNHCSTKFNFFHKELSCANCRMSFCNKCLKQKTKVPGKGACELSVCRTCYASLTSGSSTNQPIIPPDAFLKRIEALDDKPGPPLNVVPKIVPVAATNSDQHLINRLEKLKDEGKGPPPTESELRRRLAALKGENEYSDGPSKPMVYVPDLRSDQQKVDSLLEYFTNERDIELSHNPQEEIEARLASLREQGVRPNQGPYITNLHDSSESSEEEVDKITKKIMDEVALEERCSGSLPPSAKQQGLTNNDPLEDGGEEEEDGNGGRSSPELPWCVLCNNDAKYRCLDCDGDLYCASCNKEAHKTWGDTDHRVVPFKQPQ